MKKIAQHGHQKHEHKMYIELPIASKEQQLAGCVEALKGFLCSIPHQFFIIENFSPLNLLDGQFNIMKGAYPDKTLMQCRVKTLKDEIKDLAISYATVFNMDSGECAYWDLLYKINYNQVEHATKESHLESASIIFLDNDSKGREFSSTMTQPGVAFQIDKDKEIGILKPCDCHPNELNISRNSGSQSLFSSSSSSSSLSSSSSSSSSSKAHMESEGSSLSHS